MLTTSWPWRSWRRRRANPRARQTLPKPAGAEHPAWSAPAQPPSPRRRPAGTREPGPHPAAPLLRVTLRHVGRCSSSPCLAPGSSLAPSPPPGGAPPACVPSHRPAASPPMCDEHVFTARSSQAMPKSGVKATVGSLSLGASGLLSAVSHFFPLLCLSLLLGCIRMEALTSPRLCVQVPAGAAPSPSSSLRPRATLPLLCSREKPHLQPPELFPSPPATTCPFLCHRPAS